MRETQNYPESSNNRVDNRPVLVVNPGHGNEPYILATSIGVEVVRKYREAGLELPIIITPLLYGDRQINILLEENPEQASLLHYDIEFGNILKQIMFHAGDFKQHLKEVNAHYDEVDQLINSRYRRDGSAISVRSMITNEPVEVSPKNIIGVIESGNRVSVRIPHRYFAFPELLSRILIETMKRPELGFDQSDMAQLAKRMIRIEAGYSGVFIPWINTFSGMYAQDLNSQPDEINGRTRTHTPTMKKNIQPTNEEIEPGIYIMLSGTGSAEEVHKSLITSAHAAGIKVYSQPWIDIEGAEKASPSIMKNSKILAIAARPGWGTIWQAMQLEKPMVITDYGIGDDPEIYFNQLTLEALRMAKKITSHAMNPEELKNTIINISPGLHRVNEAIHQKFGTTDGIEYIARHIFSDLMPY